MTLEGVYGIRPDLLPRSMVRVIRAEQPSDRLLIWVGRPGVELLDLDQHLRYEGESIERYPRNPDGTIEWSSVPRELVLSSMESGSVELITVIRQHTPGAGSLVFLWGSLAIPSVKMEIDSSVSHLPDIMESIPEFWIYSPNDRIVLEHSFAGIVTVAHVP